MADAGRWTRSRTIRLTDEEIGALLVLVADETARAEKHHDELLARGISAETACSTSGRDRMSRIWRKLVQVAVP